MLNLKPHEECPYSSTCPYNVGYANHCKGADSTRSSPFSCDLVNHNTFVEGKFRSNLDETGQMKVLLEDSK